MKFVEVLERLLPGAETWSEETVAEARACLEKAGPIFSDLLDEDGADSAAPPTATTSPETPAAGVTETPAAPASPTPAPEPAPVAPEAAPAGEPPAAPAA